MTEFRSPHPGEALAGEGVEPATPRQAATVILLRGGAHELEVLLVKRNPEQRFMGGAWVFPGGAVDSHEAEDGSAHRIAGVREVQEEAGVVLSDPHSLVEFSRWITPSVVKIRFDTRFFLAALPAGAEPRCDGHECVDLGFFSPAQALEAQQRGEIVLVFPTMKTLEQLSGFETADELLAWAKGREVLPIEPRVIVEGEVARVVLPGEPGYEA